MRTAEFDTTFANQGLEDAVENALDNGKDLPRGMPA
jgi:hypothetical protein